MIRFPTLDDLKQENLYWSRDGQMLYRGQLFAFATVLIKHRITLEQEATIEDDFALVLKGRKPAYLTFGADMCALEKDLNWDNMQQIAKSHKNWTLLIQQGRNYAHPNLFFLEAWFAPTSNIPILEEDLRFATTLKKYCTIFDNIDSEEMKVVLDTINQTLVGLLLGYPIEDIARFINARIEQKDSSRIITKMFGNANAQGTLEPCFEIIYFM